MHRGEYDKFSVYDMEWFKVLLQLSNALAVADMQMNGQNLFVFNVKHVHL